MLRIEHIWKAKVSFVPGKTGDLVIIKGWPNAREVLTGTRYKVTNQDYGVADRQTGHSRGGEGIGALRRRSRRRCRHSRIVASHDLAKLLGSLTVDIPSVIIASAIGSAAGTLAAGTLVIGRFAFGPLLVAFGVGVLAGYAPFKLDEAFGITEKVTKMYESALEELRKLWDKLGAEAEQKFNEFENSRAVRYIGDGVNTLGQWFNSGMRRLGEGNNAQYMMQSLM